MKALVIAMLALVVSFGPAATTFGQRAGMAYPSISYFASFHDFHDGEFKDALENFNDERRGALQKPGVRWLDSICYFAMLGECYYRMGQLEEALDNYTAALQLYIQYNDWLVLVQMPSAVRATNRKPCPWGASKRGAQYGEFPERAGIRQGEINLVDRVQQGGVVQQAITLIVHPFEIARCTCLAIRRRTEILGPHSPHDPVTRDLLDVLSRRPAPPNHWSQVLIDAQLGLALAAAGKQTDAVATLNRAIVAAGQYNHPLTPTVLFELGRIALDRGDAKTALDYFEEASVAGYFDDPCILEEALRMATVAHLASNGQGLYSVLPTATAWAKRNRFRHLQASLLLCAAECQLVANVPRDAAKLLNEAKLLASRRTMGAGMIGARYHYLLATLHFQNRQLAEGYQELSKAIAFMQTASRWMFQLSLMDRQFLSGAVSVSSAITPRIAMQIYELLLRDPTGLDWTLRPMEALTVLKTPHAHSFEHWFLVAMSRKSPERALEISDLARRHRFHSSLPFGGRLLSLRAILEAPEGELDREQQLERQNLLAEYASYEALTQEAQALREELLAMPLRSGDAEKTLEQREAFQQWQELSNHQEAVLREIAVRRETASLVFPPVRSLQEVREALPQGHALLAFFKAKGETYGFLVNRDDYTYWMAPSADRLVRALAVTLRDMGHFGRNKEFTVEELTDQAWKESATKMLEMILAGSRADFAAEFPELVIVPDDAYWYVPFEALQVEVDGNLRPLIDRFRIRYAPTVSLAAPFGETPTNAPGQKTYVALGRLSPRDAPAVAQAALDQIAAVVPRTEVVPSSPMPAPSSLLGPLMPNLIVLDDIQAGSNGPYSWSPLQAERGKPGNTLAEWFPLPYGGPNAIMLPGFHTAAEDSLKTMPAPPGNEIFLSLCGLMANGAHTVLMSRWRAGGQSAIGFVREFCQELPHTTPADAYQRAVLSTAGSWLEIDREPRVRKALEAAPKGNHPFFWAGFMLIHAGVAERPPVGPEAALPNVDLVH